MTISARKAVAEQQRGGSTGEKWALGLTKGLTCAFKVQPVSSQQIHASSWGGDTTVWGLIRRTTCAYKCLQLYPVLA